MGFCVRKYRVTSNCGLNKPSDLQVAPDVHNSAVGKQFAIENKNVFAMSDY